MPQDPFFTQDNCDRCHKSFSYPGGSSRIMSWFTNETICNDCSTKEREIKAALHAKGIKDAMEGCGFIPEKGKHY
jgi:hypothetical protein